VGFSIASAIPGLAVTDEQEATTITVLGIGPCLAI
jgi:hypothetical protein